MSNLNTLALVRFSNGDQGFAARNHDSSFGWQAVYNSDGESLSHDPGPVMVLRELGKFEAGDTEAFWDLVALA